MTRSAASQYQPDVVSRPGETLQELLDERAMTQRELAARTGRPPKMINQIIKGKVAITPETALQLESVLGVSAEFWLNRERQFQEWLARRRAQEAHRAHVDWLTEIPIAALARHGWVKRCRDRAQQVAECLRFFGVASPEEWTRVYAEPQASFRKSSTFESEQGATAAWLRAGELAAQRLSCVPYDEHRFGQVLRQLRGLTTEPPAVFAPELLSLCAGAGVAVAFVPQIRGCPASGATRWLSPTKALIQLSLRYKRDDHLWFTFFHEAGHIVLHGKRDVFLEDDRKKEGDHEEEANRFARDLLIPPAQYERLRTYGPPWRRARVAEFAREIGVAPGVVVGRLQHDRLLPYGHLNGLKVKLKLVEAKRSDE